ncbi:UNVERIFIED_CONTAM: hypothetical protein Sradi_1871400 [Sesamum radiatum]|uniref:Retrotransposon gag domain-containing protein n=1 Tax=Sesamum radiatum TaxID=300843 RepID=A0AAW2TWP9_SESRA
MEYSLSAADGIISSIVLPTVQANNFEIKPSIIQIICVSDDVVRLKIFPFSLCDTAKDWLQSLLASSITTWASLTQKFLAKYFPPAKTAKMLNDITSFVQLDRESLYDAWERFKGMLRRCPHHELPVWLQVCIMMKLPSEAFNIIDEIATNLYSYELERIDKRVADVHNIDARTTLSAQIAALTQKVDNLGVVIWNGAPIGSCGVCGQMGYLSQDRKMPSYAKFLKEVISNKRKWEGGASVNLMQYSNFEKLGMHELTPTIITLQLADRSIKYPRGIVEDVLVKVGKFIIPVDFIVLDMEEDVNMPLILGRPFLATNTRHEPNRKKRWRNQVYKNGGLYKKHTKAWDESHMRKTKFEDGDKRHHKHKAHIKVDWQRIKHYLEGTLPARMERPLLPSHP